MKRWLKRLAFYASWPGLCVYFARGARSRVAVVDRTGRILLVKGLWKRWYDDDGWALPGGGLSRTESPAQAAARELAEELGIHAQAAELQLLAHERITEYGLGYDAYIFKLVVDAATPLALQASEIAAAGWHRMQDLPLSNLKPDVRRALQLLAARR